MVKYIGICSITIVFSMAGMEPKKHTKSPVLQRIKTVEDNVTNSKHSNEFSYVKEKRRSMSIDSGTAALLALKDITQAVEGEKQGALKKQRSNEDLPTPTASYETLPDISQLKLNE